MFERRWFAIAIPLVLASQGCEWRANTILEPPSQQMDAAFDTERFESGKSVRPDLDSFYAKRLGIAHQQTERGRDSRTSIHEADLEWVTTVQDARVALMVSRELGFDTWGIETMVAEIPKGWHTGKHRHGEEAIYIVTGSGIIVVNGVGYEFSTGTTIGIPYGSSHQLFNTGSDPVRYVSATASPLEAFLGLDMLEQLEEAGPTPQLPPVPMSRDGLDQQGRRIRLRWRQAEYREGSVGLLSSLRARVLAGVTLSAPDESGEAKAENRKARVATGIGHHSAWIRLMGGNNEAGFANRLVVMSHLLVDEPGVHSGKHAHMNAVLYVIQGVGHSVVDGESIEWRPGSSFQIRGPQTRHQHFNTGSQPAFMLRIASGLRPHLQEALSDTFPYLWFEGQGRIED